MSDRTDANSARKDAVIFVHGTGAGDVADDGVRWWQRGSTFGQAFAATTDAVTVAAPFHWSGKNSERERRAAGAALLQRLLDLETDGLGYHLVGHSHGGSVIWHALSFSAERGTRLEALRSWTTVGTPFITFVPRPPNVWRWIAAAVILGLAAQLLATSSLTQWPDILGQLVVDRAYLDLARLAFVFALVAGLVLWATLRVLLPAALWLADLRRRRAMAAAANWYADRWLALWHPLDEPINSLAGTIGDAPRIAPRWSQRPLLRRLPGAGPLLDGVFMRAADQFAWKQVTDRAQGADIANLAVLHVGRAPMPLEPGYQPLGPELVAVLTENANASSLGLVARVRALLESAYDRQGIETIVDQVGTIVSFQELIHTSYFDNPGVTALISTFIRRMATPVPAAPAQAEAPPLPQRLPPPASAARRTSRGQLEFVAALMFVIPAVVLSVLGRSAVDNVIAPYTIAFQVAQIAAITNEPRVLAAAKGSRWAEVALRLNLYDPRSDPIKLLDTFVQPAPRREAMLRLAMAFGRAADPSKVARLLDRNDDDKTAAEYRNRARAVAYLGYTDGAPHDPATTAAFLKFVDDYLQELSGNFDSGSIPQKNLTNLVFLRLAVAGETGRMQKMIALVRDRAKAKKWSPATTSRIVCGFVQQSAENQARVDPSKPLQDIIATCDDAQLAAAMVPDARGTAFMFHGMAGVAAFDKANGTRARTEDEVNTAILTALKSNDVNDDQFAAELYDLLPDISMIEGALDAAMLQRLKQSTHWPNRIADRFYERFADLAGAVRAQGAVHLADVLLDLADAKIKKTDDATTDDLLVLITALNLAGRKDAATARLAQLRQQVQAMDADDGDRFDALNALVRAAQTVGDTALLAAATDQLLATKISEPTWITIATLTNLAESIISTQRDKGVKVLDMAVSYAENSATGEIDRSTIYSWISAAWVKYDDVRRALLYAQKIDNVDSELEAFATILDSGRVGIAGPAETGFGIGPAAPKIAPALQKVLDEAGANPLGPSPF